MIMFDFERDRFSPRPGCAKTTQQQFEDLLSNQMKEDWIDFQEEQEEEGSYMKGLLQKVQEPIAHVHISEELEKQVALLTIEKFRLQKKEERLRTKENVLNVALLMMGRVVEGLRITTETLIRMDG